MAFLSGGYLPAEVRGGAFSCLISVVDWYGTLAALAGVPPHDHVAALPPVDSVVGLWDALMVPNGTSSPRTELLLSYSCVVGATANACRLRPRESIEVLLMLTRVRGTVGIFGCNFAISNHKKWIFKSLVSKYMVFST